VFQDYELWNDGVDIKPGVDDRTATFEHDAESIVIFMNVRDSRRVKKFHRASSPVSL
jgi:hypothetical protein